METTIYDLSDEQRDKFNLLINWAHVIWCHCIYIYNAQWKLSREANAPPSWIDVDVGLPANLSNLPTIHWEEWIMWTKAISNDDLGLDLTTVDYNNSIPEKYRINFFILANVSGGHNFIFHIDVYQCKNSENIFIPQEIWDLPTT